MRQTTPMKDHSCFSCWEYSFSFRIGSSFRSLLTFFCRMIGLYVSGIKKNAIVVQTPAKIIMTQNTHRQEIGLSMMLRLSSKERMRVRKRTHNPATIGPRTRPMKTLAVKRVVAGPRPIAGQISAMTPDNMSRKRILKR